ncbi:MAG: RDD family protein, partial [Dehalococcoidia bacterium]
KATANFCSQCGSLLPATTSAPTSPVGQAPAPAPILPWGAPPSISAERVCYSCGRSWGTGRCCQYCRQVDDLPDGIHLSSPLKRLAAWLLDAVLAILTLGIGWLVWSLIVYKDGQTPGKQLLGMRCVIFATGRPAGWGRMFCREWLAKGLLFSVLLSLTLGLGMILYFWLLWDKDRQEIWDKIVDTIVVDDPAKELLV